eukprot:scaffold44476_cov21-Tisochrysis_lutea.AAC.3
MARECAGGKLQGWEAATSVCNRCGLDTCECAGKGDYLRCELVLVYWNKKDEVQKKPSMAWLLPAVMTVVAGSG